MVLEVGNRLGPYEILSKLGAGGMGEVYRARDTRLDREVAVKVLPDELAADETALARFGREAKAVAALSHPNILALFDVGREEDISYAVTELLEGQTLRDRIAEGALPARAALEYALQIAEGLFAAHSRGLVHRDVKPENIFLTRDGHLKLLDFGLARSYEPTQPSNQTVSLQTTPGTIIGTLEYMSPEQARGENVNQRSDVFSFGVVLFEMLAGESPFKRPSPAETISALLSEEPPGLPTQTPSEKALDEVVRRCLRKQAAERFESADDLRPALQSILALESGSLNVAASTHATSSTSNGDDELVSIAVLPFADMSPAKDQDYFCEGMAEEILVALSAVEGLRVAARSSTFQFKGKTQDVQKIGAALGVTKLLEGSVRAAGKRLRVSAQLVNVADGYQLWSTRFDRDAEDVFAIQDEIAKAVVSALQIKLAKPAGQDEGGARHSQNVEAYHNYLKGRYERYTTLDFLASIREYEKALAEDPRYALARIGIAESAVLLAVYGIVRPRVAIPRVETELGYAHALMGATSEACAIDTLVQAGYYRNWEAARQSGRRAVELDPRSIIAWAWSSMAYSATLQHDEAVRAAARLIEIDPLSPYCHTIAAFAFLNAGRYEESIAAAEQSLELEANFPLTLHVGGMSYTSLGRHDESAQMLERVMEITSRSSWSIAFFARGRAAAGRTDEARALLEELRERQRWSHVAGVWLAWILGALGEVDAAIGEFERSIEERDPLVVWTALPANDPYRDHPRFRALLTEMGVA